MDGGLQEGVARRVVDPCGRSRPVAGATAGVGRCAVHPPAGSPACRVGHSGISGPAGRGGGGRGLEVHFDLGTLRWIVSGDGTLDRNNVEVVELGVGATVGVDGEEPVVDADPGGDRPVSSCSTGGATGGKPVDDALVLQID